MLTHCTPNKRCRGFGFRAYALERRSKVLVVNLAVVEKPDAVGRRVQGFRVSGFRIWGLDLPHIPQTPHIGA